MSTVTIRIKTEAEFKDEGLWDASMEVPKGWNHEGEMNCFMGEVVEAEQEDNFYFIDGRNWVLDGDDIVEVIKGDEKVKEDTYTWDELHKLDELPDGITARQRACVALARTINDVDTMAPVVVSNLLDIDLGDAVDFMIEMGTRASKLDDKIKPTELGEVIDSILTDEQYEALASKIKGGK